MKVHRMDPRAGSLEFYQRTATFIQSQSPTLKTWTARILSDCWVITVAEGEYIRAIVWAHAMPGCAGVLELHAAASKEARGRWLSQRNLDALFQATVSLPGCKTLTAQVYTPLHRRVWAGLGFTIIEGIAYMDVSDWITKNG